MMYIVHFARYWLAPKTRPVISVDCSDKDKYKQHFDLRAGLAVCGRTLTLYEEVHTIETKEKLATHRQFLQRLNELLPLQNKLIRVWP